MSRVNCCYTASNKRRWESEIRGGRNARPCQLNNGCSKSECCIDAEEQTNFKTKFPSPKFGTGVRQRNMAEGVGGKGDGEEPGTLSEPEDGTQAHCMHGAGYCKWFNVRMGFGFISMTSRGGYPVDPPVDVFVHQAKWLPITRPLAQGWESQQQSSEASQN